MNWYKSTCDIWKCQPCPNSPQIIVYWCDFCKWPSLACHNTTGRDLQYVHSAWHQDSVSHVYTSASTCLNSRIFNIRQKKSMNTSLMALASRWPVTDADFSFNCFHRLPTTGKQQLPTGMFASFLSLVFGFVQLPWNIVLFQIHHLDYILLKA